MRSTLSTLLAAAALATPSLAGDLLVPSQFGTIQAALDAALTGDRVLVAAGTYLEQDLDFGGKGIELVGAGAGLTVIDAGGLGRVMVFDSAEPSTARVVDLSLTGGVAPTGAAGSDGVSSGSPGGPASTGEPGGGVLIEDASPTFVRVTFVDNAAGAGGRGGDGAPGVSSSSPTPGGVGGTGGRGGDGGAVYVDGGSPSFEACRFDSNEAGIGGAGGDAGAAGDGTNNGADGADGVQGGLGGDGGEGGAVVVVDGTATLVNCVLIENSAGHGGAGGLGGDGGDGDSPATGSGGDGGNAGRGGDGGDGGDGGGVDCPTGTLTLLNCAVATNQRGASGSGGAPGSPGAGGDGGFIGSDGDDGFPNVPGSDGTAGTGGGSAPGATGLVLRNTVARQNSAPDIPAGPVVTYSNVAGGFPGTGNIDAAALFLDLPNGDLHVLASSPCIDAGDPNTAGLPTFDFDGEPRVQGLRVDIGPDERLVLPGTGEDLELSSYVNGTGDPLGAVKAATAGDVFALDLQTPGGTFVGAVALIGVQPYATGSVLPADPFLPGFQVNTGLPGLIGFTIGSGTPLGTTGLGPFGISFAYAVPPGLAGTSVRWQGLVFSSAALNGSYATTNALDVQIL